MLTGETRKRADVLRLDVNEKRAKIKLPAGYNRRHKKSAVRMRDEITFISAGDEQRVTDSYETRARRRIVERNEREMKTV